MFTCIYHLTFFSKKQIKIHSSLFLLMFLLTLPFQAMADIAGKTIETYKSVTNSIMFKVGQRLTNGIYILLSICAMISSSIFKVCW